MPRPASARPRNPTGWRQSEARHRLATDHRQDEAAEARGGHGERKTAEAEQRGTGTPEPRKTFADWSVEEVCELVQRIGFTDAARVLAENRVDGKTLCSADFDCFLVMKISDGGLGLTPMQKIRLKEEIKRATQHI